MKFIFPLFLCCLFLSEVYSQKISAFTLASPQKQATIVLLDQEPEHVRLAVQDLVNDVERISGKKLQVVNRLQDSKGECVVVGTITNPASAKLLQSYNLPELHHLTGKWEAYTVKSVAQHKKPASLIIAGSDDRGTMFAIYHFIDQYLQVDPMHYWSDIAPQKRETLSWDKISIDQAEPTFQYRGWFINDEDLLTEWVESNGKRNIDYPYYGQVVSPEVMRHVLDALLRLRYNLIIPASFIDIRNPAEAQLVKEAARRGVFLSMHHVEPMGVSAFTFFNYWQQKNNTKPLFSFYSSRKELEEVWRVYATEWAKYPNVIWQIGLRGIGDRPMWMADPGIPQTDAERGKLISDAMHTQMEIIRSVVKQPNPPVTTTLWAEGAGLNQQGHLTFPKEAAIIFADNSPGWKWQADFYETVRHPERKYGIYYHHQLWGSGPHLAQAIPPQRTYQVIKEAVQKDAHHYAILNVSNVREFALGVEATSHMLYNFSSFNSDQFLSSWCQERFGAAGEEATKAYQAYFDSFVMHDIQQVPILLDGQTRGRGINILNDLSLQITDVHRYAAKMQQKKAETVEASWGRTFLADMHPKEENLEALLMKVKRQQAGLQKAQTQINKTMSILSSDRKQFFQTNLAAHQQIMSGLLVWLEAVIEAKLAEENGRRQETVTHLQKASEAFKVIRQGQKLTSEGSKWQHWYRGDKKMNLANMESLTQKVLQQAKE